MPLCLGDEFHQDLNDFSIKHSNQKPNIYSMGSQEQTVHFRLLLLALVLQMSTSIKLLNILLFSDWLYLFSHVEFLAYFHLNVCPFTVIFLYSVVLSYSPICYLVSIAQFVSLILFIVI